ncbi:MAG: mannose-1-phosphate guanylyltransferase [Actinomycetes bacterium]
MTRKSATPGHEAVVLVGGKGTRLRPLTVDMPKPMLPTAGVPFLHHVLSRARDAGIEHVVLATSYRPEVFEAGIGDGSSLGLRVDYVTEVEPLGTGGAISNVGGLLESKPDDPVVILNGDILSDHDIAAQLEAHVAANADVSLHLTEVEDPRAFGCVPTDVFGRVTEFLEKTPHPITNRINAGCYVFARRVIDDIPTGRKVSVERETFPGLLRDGALVIGHVDGTYWLDVGTPAAFVQGSRDLVLGRLASPALPGATGELLVMPGARVADTAVVSGGTTVGAGAVIAADATVEGSVLLDGAVVGPGAVVRDSVVGYGARIGERTVLDGVVVGDRAVVGADNELLAGCRIWCEAVLPDRSVRFSSDQIST